MRNTVNTAYLRVKFNSASTCDWPYLGKGPAHPGHMKCIQFRKRKEAEKRNATYMARLEGLRKAQALNELVGHVNKEANSNKRHRRRTRK